MHNFSFTNVIFFFQYTCNIENTVLETFVPIPYADEEISGAGNPTISLTQKTDTKPVPDKGEFLPQFS